MSGEQLDNEATILIADDFDEWRLQVRKMLHKHPEWKVVGEACDGRDAVEKASQLQPHVAILDISMPGLNGIEAARLIRQRCPLTRIVFLTQQADEEVIEAARAAGGSGYVLKTNSASDLTRAIAAALQSAPAAPFLMGLLGSFR